MAERGVFWVIDGELAAYPFDETATEGVAKSGNTYNHKRLWEHVKPCNKPFDYYPRGRVEITNSGAVKIFMSPHIGAELLPPIMAAFGITAEPTVIYDHSEHYQCHLDKEDEHFKMHYLYREGNTYILSIVTDRNKKPDDPDAYVDLHITKSSYEKILKLIDSLTWKIQAKYPMHRKASKGRTYLYYEAVNPFSSGLPIPNTFISIDEAFSGESTNK